MSLRLIKASKETHTVTDTIEITPKLVADWKIPPFQRPIRVNAKVSALSEELRSNGGVLPGVITIGLFRGARYIVDGQHRVHAFLLAECAVGYTDVRFRDYPSMKEMADDFVKLNSNLVRMRPDDILRGLEGTSHALTHIRKQCTFVGYDQIRRASSSSAILSMSALLRCWSAAGAEVPGSGGVKLSAADLPSCLTLEDAEEIVRFLDLAVRGFGRDPEYYRLWGNLNLTLSMWLYRRIVLKQWSPRIPKLTREQFVKCLSSLSASSDYLDWLVARGLTEKDRSPCFTRMKKIFQARLREDLGTQVKLPAPDWVMSH